MWIRAAALLFGLSMLAVGLPALAQSDDATFEDREVDSDRGSMRYRVFVPSTFAPQRPLVVALHGGNDSVESTAAVSGWNVLAEEHGFVVAYPQEDPDNGRLGIWNWSPVARHGRDDQAASLVALVTQTVIEEFQVDARRVLVSGMSAGGGMAVAMAVVYPELYAAVGAESGCMYGGLRCIHPPACTTEGCQTEGLTNAYLTGEESGHAAYEAMGARAERMPAIISYGTADPAAAGVGQEELVQQWLVTNDWIDDGASNESVPRTEASSTTGQEGELDYQLRTYADADGCTIVERWTIEGLDHAYSGARSEDGSGPGPDMRLHQYRFLRAQTSPEGDCPARAAQESTRPVAQQEDEQQAEVADAPQAPPAAPPGALPATGGTSPLAAALTALLAVALLRRRPGRCR